jgi:ABC-type branched-subunit amino acid transport system substrate-binding protein
MKNILIHGMVFVCLLGLIGCVARPSTMPHLGGTQPIVKIGLAAPFEGLDRPLGYDALAGAKLALSERNATGGVGGYVVELVALNDFGEPDEARLQAREFAADPAVLGVITGWTSETMRASVAVYQQVGLAVAVPWSVLPELADRGSGVVLVAADAQQSAYALTKAVAATYPRRLVVVGDGPSATLYEESADELGLNVYLLPPPDVLDSEITQEWVNHLVWGQPDALILAMDGARTGETILTLAEEDWSGTTLGGVESGSIHLVNVAGSLAAGLTFVSPAPAGQDVAQPQGNLTPDMEGLGPRAVLAYDATHVLLDAIELAIQEDGYPSRQGVKTTLPRVQRRGLTGDIVFDAAGRRVDAPVWLYNIVDKSYPGRVLVSPQADNGE